jgi:hypothetical protein
MNNFNRTDFILLYNYITTALQRQAPLFVRSSYLWFRLGVISYSHLHYSRPCVWSLPFYLPFCCTLLHMEVPQVSHFIYTWVRGQLLFQHHHLQVPSPSIVPVLADVASDSQSFEIFTLGSTTLFGYYVRKSVMSSHPDKPYSRGQRQPLRKPLSSPNLWMSST